MTWSPDDDELDALARTIPAPPRGADRVERTRTALLASAGTQQRRRTYAPVVGVALALAAAAAVLVWVIGGDRPVTRDKLAVAPVGLARFERATSWPDYVVRADDGYVSVHLEYLDAGERFRVKTADGEVESRMAHFVVATERGRLARVAVSAGSVEIRWGHESPVFLSTGQMWTPVRTAEVIVDRQPVAVIEKQPTVIEKPPAVVEKQPAKPKVPAAKPAKLAPAVVVEEPVAPEASPRPGEADFRAGVAALRGGDAAGATRSFAAACTAAVHDALGEDACFWVGAAAKRAGQTAVARDALARFIRLFPKSARAGEAAALLGWILVDANDLDGAKKLFESARTDRVPNVRDSAQRGLTAIERKR